MYVRKAKEKHEDDLLSRKNVVMVSTGKKEVRKEETHEDAVLVWVRKKESEDVLNTKDVVPKFLDIGGREVKTDVIEIGSDIKPLTYTSRQRPCPSGYSIGHVDITAGTLGCLVKHKKTGRTMILTNNHVGADCNRADKGDAWLQPAPYDDGERPSPNDDDIGDKIAELFDYIEIDTTDKPSNCKVAGAVRKILNSLSTLLGRETRFKIVKENNYNEVDCAIGEPVDNDMLMDKIKDIGKPDGSVNFSIGDTVEKTGRTTEHSNNGNIKSIDGTSRVRGYGGLALFKNQNIIKSDERFSKGGDSGSVIVKQGTNKIGGLLFAGSRDGKTTIANHIDVVEDKLGVEVI